MIEQTMKEKHIMILKWDIMMREHEGFAIMKMLMICDALMTFSLITQFVFGSFTWLYNKKTAK